MDKLELAKWLHDNYEEVAKTKGWNTQESCKVEFDNLPDDNKSTMIEIADRLLNFNLLSKHFVSGSFLADEFHEWIELNDWQFNPVWFNGVIKYRWVNETYSGQATTKDLYEIFLSQK